MSLGYAGVVEKGGDAVWFSLAYESSNPGSFGLHQCPNTQ